MGNTRCSPVRCMALPTGFRRSPVYKEKKFKSAPRLLIIDGNNLMHTKKVPFGRELLTERLKGIMARYTIVVFNGRPGEVESATGYDPRVVVTQGADEFGRGRQTVDEWVEGAILASKDFKEKKKIE